jgi:hypothetical protein
LAVSWVKGSRFKTDPNIAKEVMDQLSAEGRLSPAELVEVSRPVDAPLHNEFEWDDKVAAQLWREKTGQIMIASIVVTQDAEEDKKPVRAYFNIERGTHEYIPTEVIFSDDAKRERLLDIAKREMVSFRTKYDSLTELAGVMKAIDEVIREDVG